MLRRRVAEVQVALMLLTRLPAGRLRGDVPGLGAAAWAYPLAGVPVGGIIAGVMVAGRWAGWTPAVAAGLALGAGLLATGALHEDGLADVADGFGGGQTRAAKLEIMKDSRLGSYGAIALGLGLGLRWLLLAGQAPGAVVALAVASRAAMVPVLALLPAARADGLGRAAAGVGAWRVCVALAIGGAALGLALPWAVAARVAIGMGIAATAVAGVARRQIGGQTGDVLGATQVVAEVAGWLALAG